VSSSTFSSKRWLQIFFALVGTVAIGFIVASEWMVRAYVLPQDNFELIAERLRISSEPNAAFGDSHVASVIDYDTWDFVNLGIGATTILRMNQRARYYFSKIKPGQVIIQADPHLFADYRLEAPGTYVPEDYSDFRLRMFDPQHRGFMQKYWTTLITNAELKPREISYDELWRSAYRLEQEAAKPKTTAEADETAEAARETMAKFNAFMQYEVSAHTPVSDFRERDQARVYDDMIKFLIARGAKVCLVNYPVDKFYRQRANAIPLFAEVRKFYKEVAQENHIPYVSFWDRFDDFSMYQNTDHVSLNGSPILAREAREACFGTPKSR